MSSETQRKLIRLLIWLSFGGVFWSFYYDSGLISVVREFTFSGGTRALARFVLSLLPLVLIPVALLKESLRGKLLWVGGVIGLAILLDVAFGGRDPDEAVHLHMSWMMAKGYVPYRDFFTARHMLWHAMCIPVVMFLEDSMMVIHAGRLLMLTCCVAFLALILPVCRRSGSHFAAPLLALAVPFFSWGAVEFRSDSPMTVCLVAALWALGKGRPGLAGCVAGLGYLMLQKAAFHGLAIGAGILLSGMGLRAFLRFSLGAVSVSLLHALWAVVLGVWHYYFLCTVQCSSMFAAYHQQTPFFESMAVLVFGVEFEHYPMLFILALVGCVSWWGSGDKFCRLLAVCVMVDLGLMFMGKIAFKNYLLFPILLLGLACGRAFGDMERVKFGKLENALPTISILLLLTIGALRHSAVPPTRVDISEATRAIELLPPEETFYGDGLRPNLINPIFRVNATYFPHDASRMSIWFGKSKMGIQPPYYWPAQNRVLLENMPGAFSMSKARSAEFLKLAKERKGTEYVEMFPDFYLRQDLVGSSSSTKNI